MKIRMIVVSIIRLVMTSGMAIIAIYSAVFAFHRMEKKSDIEQKLKKNNIAVAILMSALFLSNALLLKNTIDPVLTNLTLVSGGVLVLFSDIFFRFFLSILQILISVFVTITLDVLSFEVFNRIIRNTNGMEEIRKDNIAMSIFISGILIAGALVLEPSLKNLLDNLVKFPAYSLENIHGTGK